MQEDKIINALVGLVGACNNNPKTENTDHVVIKTLAFPSAYQETNDETLPALIEEIYAEKYTVAPGCATCQTPCGNTSDYDMNRIYEAGTDIRDLKLKMIAALRELAADVYRHQKPDALSADSMEIFYKILAYISYDMETDSLLTFWNEVQVDIEKVRREIHG